MLKVTIDKTAGVGLALECDSSGEELLSEILSIIQVLYQRIDMHDHRAALGFRFAMANILDDDAFWSDARVGLTDGMSMVFPRHRPGR